jgi:hypothetical protein
MPSIRQHNAWKKLAEAGKAYRYKRKNRSVLDRVDEHEQCLWFLVAVVSVLVALEIIKLWK